MSEPVAGRTGESRATGSSVSHPRAKPSVSKGLNAAHPTRPPDKRVPKLRGERAEGTRQRIVEAAAVAFAERGYMGVNLADVVESLGLTKGALYYFFPTKESLAVEIVERHFQAWPPVVGEVLAAHDNELDAVVALTFHVATMFDSDALARAGTRLSAEHNLIEAELPKPFVGWVDTVTDILNEGLENGTVRSGVDPRQSAEILVAFFAGAHRVATELHEEEGLPRRLEAFWSQYRPLLETPARSSGATTSPHPAPTRHRST